MLTKYSLKILLISDSSSLIVSFPTSIIFWWFPLLDFSEKRGLQVFQTFLSFPAMVGSILAKKFLF